jgi:uncharacterized protein (TIGR03083 family)
MEFERYLTEIDAQADAALAKAAELGPAQRVPSCPQWTVQDLLAHLARVHRWALGALDTPPDGKPPALPEGPADYVALLDWAAEGARALIAALRAKGPDHPCWVFRGSGAPTASFWARRQAHETAIHRLDVELVSGTAPPLLFDPEFAADGVDELLVALMPAFTRRRGPVSVDGRVLVHAADAGRAWLIRLRKDSPLEIGPVDSAAVDVDAGIAGTADAVYRAVWGRESHAAITGDPGLLVPIAAP